MRKINKCVKCGAELDYNKGNGGMEELNYLNYSAVCPKCGKVHYLVYENVGLLTEQEYEELKKGEKYNVTLTIQELNLLSLICHKFKECNRESKERVIPVVQMEENIQKQTDFHYFPDTTYDIKDNKVIEFDCCNDEILKNKILYLWENESVWRELCLILAALIHRDSSTILEQCGIEIATYTNDEDMVREIAPLWFKEFAYDEDLQTILTFLLV